MKEKQKPRSKEGEFIFLLFLFLLFFNVERRRRRRLLYIIQHTELNHPNRQPNDRSLGFNVPRVHSNRYSLVLF